MRIWSIHPRHLDPRGLVTLWREGLLARAVLLGKTRGYRQHPQLDRWKSTRDPVAAIEAYLSRILEDRLPPAPARAPDGHARAARLRMEAPAGQADGSRAGSLARAASTEADPA